VFRRVLFATDFSDVSRHAGRTAAALARHFSAPLHVVHVRPSVADAGAARSLAAAAAELGPDVMVVTETLTGLPARQIVAHARRAGVDLIVVGTHGRTGVSRALLGSVAEAVVRRAPCRVLTVPGETPPAAVEEEEAAGVEQHCIVCAKSSPDLICEPCRALIRGEVLEAKRLRERPGRSV
jgi:nucleotide-binding universal stress UspA family protein